jgi:hypothetical protein
MNSTASPRSQLEPRVLENLRERMRLASDMAETVDWLRGKGYNDEAILNGIESVRPRGNALEQGFMTPPLMARAPANLR